MCASACASVVTKTYVALAADGLVAVVLGGKSLEGRLNDTTTETEHQVKSRLLLDVVVGESATIFELLSGEDEALLVWGDAFLVLDLGLHRVFTTMVLVVFSLIRFSRRCEWEDFCVGWAALLVSRRGWE